jgi:hypothetical protein
MAPFECPLQSTKEVEVTGCLVGTVEGAVLVIPNEGVNMADRCCCRGGLASSNTLVRPSQNCWYHRRTICIDMTSEPHHACRARTIPLSCFNTTLRRHRLRDESRTSHKKRGRLPVDTEHSDTPPVLRGPRKKKWVNLFSDYPTCKSESSSSTYISCEKFSWRSVRSVSSTCYGVIFALVDICSVWQWFRIAKNVFIIRVP